MKKKAKSIAIIVAALTLCLTLGLTLVACNKAKVSKLSGGDAVELFNTVLLNTQNYSLYEVNISEKKIKGSETSTRTCLFRSTENKNAESGSGTKPTYPSSSYYGLINEVDSAASTNENTEYYIGRPLTGGNASATGQDKLFTKEWNSGEKKPGGTVTDDSYSDPINDTKKSQIAKDYGMFATTDMLQYIVDLKLNDAYESFSVTGTVTEKKKAYVSNELIVKMTYKHYGELYIFEAKLQVESYNLTLNGKDGSYKLISSASIFYNYPSTNYTLNSCFNYAPTTIVMPKVSDWKNN
ncbi:MAG: hypothetical protein RR338_01410 [Clostridia bacterium]